MSAVKKSAITYAGSEYQTLYGIFLLAEWLNDPTKYIRVCVEADKEAPQGIDDVVCVRSDNKTDFYQIKFTPSQDNEKNSLNFDWLLAQKNKNSRSILKKSFDAIEKVDNNNLGEVTLVTNKVPSREIEDCLVEKNIDFTKLSHGRQNEIIKQLGSESNAKRLFLVLKIKHSFQDNESLQRTVRMLLEKHSNEEGVLRLLNEARNWAISKNQPSINGWISLQNIREVLSLKRPRSMSESFRVPEDYCLPDQNFHDNLFQAICNFTHKIITIVGPPGRGKSTYLSYLCKQFEENNIPVIRHHYFLPVNDPAVDRLTPNDVIHSLVSQLKNHDDEIDLQSYKPEEFRSILAKCSAPDVDQKKLFVVIIDGLDHVWRDNDRDKQPLDALFNLLLPLPENVILLVGTQPVGDRALPDILLEYCPREEWQWLPAMSGNAIYEYLRYQYDAGRVQLSCSKDMIENELRESAEALVKITSGYPLHVIYSNEYLIKNNIALSAWQIQQLPTCDNENIETYYKKLWRKLSCKQQDVLYLCCAFQFSWPKDAFLDILGEENGSEINIQAVSHLLYQTTFGLKPFHESLLVFVKKKKEYEKRIITLLEGVCNWLDKKASIYLKNSWYWLCVARKGDTTPLRTGITRNWVLDRLSEGYSPVSIIRLLTEAEKSSFKDHKFSEAYKHNALKTRLIDGPEFQIWDLPTLEYFSLASAPQALMDHEVSLYEECSIKRLIILSLALWHRNDFLNAKFMASKAIEKHASESKLYHQNNIKNKEAEDKLIITAGVLSETLDLNNIFEEGALSEWPGDYVDAFIAAAVIKKDLELLFKLHRFSSREYRGNIEATIIQLSILEEAEVTAWNEFNDFDSLLAGCLKQLNTEEIEDISIFKSDNSMFSNGENFSYHEWFFTCLYTRLAAKGAFCYLSIKSNNDYINREKYFEAFSNAAYKVVEHIRCSEQKAISFSDVYNLLLGSIKFERLDQIEEKMEIVSVKRRCLEIAIDCHLLTAKKPIDQDELAKVISNENFVIAWLREWCIKKELKILTNDAVKQLIEHEYRQQNIKLDETITRANENLELAKLAFQYDQTDLMNRHKKLCWDYVIGYGSHKDTLIFKALSSIKYISTRDPDYSLRCLKRISPIVINIHHFTDGDETKSAFYSMNEILARLSPSTLASIYDYEVKNGEWYKAECALQSLLKQASFESKAIRMLCLTGLSEECRNILLKKTEAGDMNAKSLLGEINNQLGLSNNSTSTIDIFPSDREDKINLNPSDFPPEEIHKLNEALRGKYATEEYCIKWYTYWEEQEKKLELLQNIEPFLKNKIHDISNIKSLYTPLFYTKKKLKGPSAAFSVLIECHKVMHGWSRVAWYESYESTKKRLRLIAAQYPTRVNEFIDKTTEDGTIIPGDKLVYLLSECGRLDDAKELTEAIIQALEEDVRNLNLPILCWDWGSKCSQEEVYINFLISRLSWPVSTIKILVCQQIAELLINNNDYAEKILLANLASKKQESECIEVLCVFFIASDMGYTPTIEIGEYINARSVLSDMLVKAIQPRCEVFGNYATTLDPYFDLSLENYDFDRMIGTEVPRIYKTLFEQEEKRTEFEFIALYESMWNATFEYAPAKNESFNYFANSEQMIHFSKLYTDKSHRGRSAFLRSLDYAQHYWRMPTAYAEDLAIHALPIEPAFTRIQPKKPIWLQSWKQNIEINDDIVRNFVEDCVKAINEQNSQCVLGALSFAIHLGSGSWLDLTIVRCIKKSSEFDEAIFRDHYYGYSIGEKLDCSLKFYASKKMLGTCIKHIPLVNSVSPSTRYGHWHSDMERRGVMAPLVNLEDKYVTSRCSTENLHFIFDEKNIGEFGFWINDWDTEHPKDISSCHGVYTLLNKETLNVWQAAENHDPSHVLACKAKLFLRENAYSEYSTRVFDLLISV